MDRIQIAVQLKGPARTETFQGRDHLVVPATLVQSQVLHNNLGRTFLPAEDITPEWAQASNGAPVVLDHPTSRGQPVSARDPDVMNARGVGHLYRTRVDDGALKGDVYLDLARVEHVEGLDVVVANVQAGQPGELSTGFPVAIEQTKGVHNGHEFDVTIHPTGPLDHLAVFADKTGACSVEDGCGLGVNCKCGHGEAEHEEEPVDEKAANKLTQAIDKLMTFLGRVQPAEPEPAEEDTAGDTTEEGDAMNRDQMIAQLAAQGADRADLDKLSEATLRALCGAEKGAPATNGDSDPESVAILQERIVELRREKERLEADTATALQAEKREKLQLQEELIYNGRTQFSDQQIRDMDIKTLRQLHGTVFQRRDFSGRGAPGVTNQGPDLSWLQADVIGRKEAN